MTFRENDEENLAHTVFTQYINEQENQMEAELAFDASFFKANRKVKYLLCLISVYSTFVPPFTPLRGPLACLTRSSRNKYVLIKSCPRPGSKPFSWLVLEIEGEESLISSKHLEEVMMKNKPTYMFKIIPASGRATPILFG